MVYSFIQTSYFIQQSVPGLHYIVTDTVVYICMVTAQTNGLSTCAVTPGCAIISIRATDVMGIM